MSQIKGMRPPWKKSSASTSAVDSSNDYLAVEENSGSNENQRLVDEFQKLLPEAKNRQVSYAIARLVGEQIHLSTSSSSLNEWKMFASALGFDDDYALRKADYWAPRAQEYPLTKLLLDDFKQRQRNLGDLIEILIAKELYAVLKEIKPRILDCIQNPPDNAYEKPCENLQFNSNRGAININISDRWTVSISSNGTSSTSSSDSSPLMSESSNSVSSASSNITDDNHHDEMFKLGNTCGNTSVCVPTKENSTFQTFNCSAECNVAPSSLGQNFPKSLAATNSYNSFHSDVKSMAHPFSSTGNCASPGVHSLKDFFASLSLTRADSATESMTSTTSVASSTSTTTDCGVPNTVSTVNGPLPVYHPIYVFITHTMADTDLANIVARRLEQDFQVVAITQLQMLPWFVTNHGDTVSRILKEVHFVMPVVTPCYLEEISLPESVDDCSHQQLSVRNIFTALQADFFNNSSLNWKIRPVVNKGTSLQLIREKHQELLVAMRLWKDWELVGLMLTNTRQYWQSRSVE